MRRALLAAIALASLSHAAGAQPADDAIAQMKSCLKSEGPIRQRCVDRLWWDLTGSNAPAASTRGGGSWVVSETTSPVDYSPQISAANPSRATAEGAPSSLTIHCRRQRVELSVSTIGAWKASSSDEFRVAYRIDDQPIVEARWAASAGGRTASFKGDALALLQSLPEGGRSPSACSIGRVRRTKPPSSSMGSTLSGKKSRKPASRSPQRTEPWHASVGSAASPVEDRLGN